MKKSLFVIWTLTSPTDKKKLFQILAVSTSNGILQALGIASIMPFIALLSDPNIAQSSATIASLQKLLPSFMQEHLLLVFGLFALFVLFIGNALAMFDYWLTLHFFNRKEHELSIQLLQRYLGLSYLDFGAKKLSTMSKNILSELERVVIGTMMSIISLVSDTIVAVAVFIVLLLVDLQVTLITTALLSFCYLFIYFGIQKKIKRLGEEFSHLESKIYSAVKQAMDLYKEIKVAGCQDFFIKRFDEPNYQAVKNSTRYHVLGYIPNQIVEILALAIIIGIALYFSQGPEREFSAIATIGVYAFATYRLVPVLKSIFAGFEGIEYGSAALQSLSADFNASIKPAQRPEKVNALTGDIHVSSLSFTYPGAPQPVFQELSFRILSGSFCAFIGPSGIGKSTLFDILLGLIPPTEGCLDVGQTRIDDTNLFVWQSQIGYVPQQVKLLDDDLLSNIAFGIERECIDRNKVERAARIAMIHDFIINELDDGYKTVVGDGGQTLSGGQKQRIGIARALYHQPHYLLLDEATNELDEATELAILDNFSALLELTILFITHKPSVYNKADQVIDIRNSTREDAHA